MRLLLVGLSLLFAFSASAQSFRKGAVLLTYDAEDDSTFTEYGQNEKKFWHAFTGYGLVVGEADGPGADLEIYGSSQFIFGVRHKRKLNNLLAVGYEFGWSHRAYRLKQDSSKVFVTPTLHDQEKVVYDGAFLGAYLRINFGKRGNFIGNYLDLGAYAEGHAWTKHVTFDKHDVATAGGASNSKVVNRGLVWAEPYRYGVIARVGFNKLTFYGDYRLSDLIKSDNANLYPELSRITVGIQLGMF